VRLVNHFRLGGASGTTNGFLLKPIEGYGRNQSQSAMDSAGRKVIVCDNGTGVSVLMADVDIF
jgi:hypothetical protein